MPDVDPEVIALYVMWTSLRKFDGETRARMLEYLADRSQDLEVSGA